MGWPTSVGTSESHQLRPTRLKPTSGLRMLAPTSTRQGIDSMGLAEGLILPIALTTTLRLTPEEFAEVCEANPDAVLELAADGSLIPMTPTGSETGSRSGELFFQIKSWARANGGWMAFDSSTGFRLHDGSVRSPDAALVALERWRALSEEHHRGFAPLCPIWWWNWPASETQAPATLVPGSWRPCAARWRPARPTAPGLAGC